MLLIGNEFPIGEDSALIFRNCHPAHLGFDGRGGPMPQRIIYPDAIFNIPDERKPRGFAGLAG